MNKLLKSNAGRRLAVAMLCFLLGLPLMLVQAQQLTVKGHVKDTTGEPMIGVSVLEKGTSNGIITDIDGNFTLQVNQGATLVLSYIGYVTQELKAPATMNVILKEDSQALEEVVVVGYGVQKKSSLTGAVSQVKAEDMEARTITRPEMALQGKTSGVQVLSS